MAPPAKLISLSNAVNAKGALASLFMALGRCNKNTIANKKSANRVVANLSNFPSNILTAAAINPVPVKYTQNSFMGMYDGTEYSAILAAFIKCMRPKSANGSAKNQRPKAKNAFMYGG